MFINKFCILNYATCNYVEKWLKEFIEIFTSKWSALENWIYSFTAFATKLNTAGISGPQISFLPFWQRKIANTESICQMCKFAALRLLLSFLSNWRNLVRSRLGLDSLSEKRAVLKNLFFTAWWFLAITKALDRLTYCWLSGWYIL